MQTTFWAFGPTFSYIFPIILDLICFIFISNTINQCLKKVIQYIILILEFSLTPLSLVKVEVLWLSNNVDFLVSIKEESLSL